MKKYALIAAVYGACLAICGCQVSRDAVLHRQGYERITEAVTFIPGDTHYVTGETFLGKKVFFKITQGYTLTINKTPERGDVNADGQINVLDQIRLKKLLYEKRKENENGIPN